MSATKDASEEVEREYNKIVNLVCYLNREGTETRRQFADRVDDSRNYFKRRTRETTTVDYFIAHDGGMVEIDEDEYEALQGVDLGDAQLTKNVEHDETKEYAYDPSQIADELSKEVVGGMKEEFDDNEQGLYIYVPLKRVKDNDGNSLTYLYRSFERMPMLKHQSEIEPDDMYEDEDEELLAVKFKIKMKNVTEDQLELLNEEYVAPMMKRLGRHEWIDKVRTFDCETETKEKGVCFNI